MAIGVVVFAAGAANAGATFTDRATIDRDDVAASATFAISGNTLSVTLATNPGHTTGATSNGLQFKLNALDPSLAQVSAISPNAILNAAACDAQSCADSNLGVGGERRSRNNFAGRLEAVGSAGDHPTGRHGDTGNVNNASAGKRPIEGIQFGIVSADVDPANLKGGRGGRALIKDTVVLTLTGGSGITESQIGNPTFLYGTSSDGTGVAGLCSTNCDTSLR